MSAFQKETLFSLTNANAIRQIHDLLTRVDYTEQGISRVLKVSDLPNTRERQLSRSLYLYQTREETPLNTLTRLFFLNQSVSLTAVEQAVAPMDLQDWVDAGLIGINQDEVIGVVELCPYQNLIVVADWADGDDANQVMSIAASSRVLMQMTVRRHAKQTLDLGTGCGIQSFVASKHSDKVFTVDCNERAIQFAKFNAALNGISNVEFATGNLFEPFHGQKFDLIVCNPPFVIAPKISHVHTSSGKPADEFCENIIQTAPAYLNEGGFFQIIFNWAQIAGQDWKERLSGWFEDKGCDAWLLYSHIEDAAEYAFKRVSEIEKQPERIATAFDEWMTYFQHEQIETVGFGILTLRRSSEHANWFRCERLQGVSGECGEAIVRGFAACDFLDANRDDNDLMKARLRCAPNVRVGQLLQNFQQGWKLAESRIRLTEGLTTLADVDDETIEFVMKCNGNMQVGDFINELAKRKGQDINQIAPRFLKVVRRLIEQGFLTN
jgi:protein-L-isoaspartate O-methyltransferase